MAKLRPYIGVIIDLSPAGTRVNIKTAVQAVIAAEDKTAMDYPVGWDPSDLVPDNVGSMLLGIPAGGADVFVGDGLVADDGTRHATRLSAQQTKGSSSQIYDKVHLPWYFVISATDHATLSVELRLQR